MYKYCTFQKVVGFRTCALLEPPTLAPEGERIFFIKFLENTLENLKKLPGTLARCTLSLINGNCPLVKKKDRLLHGSWCCDFFN